MTDAHRICVVAQHRNGDPTTITTTTAGTAAGVTVTNVATGVYCCRRT